MQPNPSPSVLIRACGGCPLACQDLVNLCAPVVVRWCRRRLNVPPADVDDVVHDVCQKLRAGLSGFDRQRGSGQFGAWLFTLTRNQAIDYQRRRKGAPQATGSSSLHERLQQQPAPSEQSDSAPADAVIDLSRRILDYLEGAFEPTTWQAFWRSVVQEQPTAEIAAALAISQNAVRLARSRVLRRLKQKFGDLLDKNL